MLAVMVAIAVGIRLIFELLAPVWPWLMAALIVFSIVRIVSWYRGRW
jgi:hypothetical protein